MHNNNTQKPNVIGGGPGSHNQVYNRHINNDAFGTYFQQLRSNDVD